MLCVSLKAVLLAYMSFQLSNGTMRASCAIVFLPYIPALSLAHGTFESDGAPTYTFSTFFPSDTMLPGFRRTLAVSLERYLTCLLCIGFDVSFLTGTRQLTEIGEWRRLGRLRAPSMPASW